MWRDSVSVRRDKRPAAAFRSEGIRFHASFRFSQDDARLEEIIGIIRRINEEGTAVILATHKMELVMNSGERYVRMDYGSIVEDWVDPLRGVK